MASANCCGTIKDKLVSKLRGAIETVKSLDAEPIILLMWIAYVTQTSFINQVVQNSVCSFFYGYNVTVCASLVSTEVEFNSQLTTFTSISITNANTARNMIFYWTAVTGLAYVLPAALTCWLYGFLADRYSIRILSIIVAIFSIISCALLIVVFKSFYSGTLLHPRMFTCVLIPVGFFGGPILMEVVVSSFVSKKYHGFQRFEKFIKVQTAIATGKGAGALVATLIYSHTGQGNWQPFLAFAISLFLFALIIPLGFKLLNFQDPDVKQQKMCACSGGGFVEAYWRTKIPLSRFSIFLLWICAFVYFFCFVGDSSNIAQELYDGVNWRLQTFGFTMAASDGAKAVSMIILTKVAKRLVDKKFVNGKVLPKMPAAKIGVIGWMSEMLALCVLVFTQFYPANSFQYVLIGVMLISVLSELAICCTKFLIVGLGHHSMAGRMLALVAFWEAVAPFLGTLTFNNAFQSANPHLGGLNWIGVVFFVQLLLMLIPIGIFCLIICLDGKTGFVDMHYVLPKEGEGSGQGQSDEVKATTNMNSARVPLVAVPPIGAWIFDMQ